MHPIQLRENVVFTEEEYETLFYGGRDNKASLMKLKCVLIKRGFKENEVAKSRYCDIENFIFNSIPREKVLYYTSFSNEKGVADKLFRVYKNLVQNISRDQKTVWDKILKFVTRRRFNSKTIKKAYFPLIVGIMVYDSGENYVTYNSTDFIRLNIHQQYILHGRDLGCYLENSVASYDGFLCSCSTETLHSFLWVGGVFDTKCKCCTQKMLSFANDCTIKMGRELLSKSAYNFLLFNYHFKDELVIDVFSTIGHMVVFA